ncbi:hypothetical protein Cni_G11031 [Canna indica]|uniref:Uncharacterized protein n=1 Tax=Canna indica TaxID=4628 RepID=A0AAQ3K9C5_9LILI|nr:hypothetical protein Cni_G11031 [Canna indica]
MRSRRLVYPPVPSSAQGRRCLSSPPPPLGKVPPRRPRSRISGRVAGRNRRREGALAAGALERQWRMKKSPPPEGLAAAAPKDSPSIAESGSEERREKEEGEQTNRTFILFYFILLYVISSN